MLTAACALIIAGVWRPALYALERGSDVPPQLAAIGALEERPGAPAWRGEPQPFTSWLPHYPSPRAALSQVYKPAAAAPDALPVALFIGYYDRQSRYGEMITYGNQIVLITDKEWSNVGEREAGLTIGDRGLKVVEAQVRGDGARFLVWKWYWINGRYTDNDYVAKALIAANVLTGRGDDSAAILLYTPVDIDRRDEAAERLRSFAAAALPVIEQRLGAANGAAHRAGQAGGLP